jgi:hypothetical protein
LALFSFTPVFACDPHVGEYGKAVQLFDQGDFRAALNIFQAVYQANPRCLGAKLDIAESYFMLGEFNEAYPLFSEINTIPDLPLGIRQRSEGFLRIMEEEQAVLDEKTNISASTSTARPVPQLQMSVGLGASDNVNNGVGFDVLRFDQGVLQGLSLQLADNRKARAGTWHDVELATQKVLPTVHAVESRAYMTATWRGNHQEDDPNLVTVKGMLELKPGEWANQLEPRAVVSGGAVLLGGEYYREDIAVGTQIQPELYGRKVALGYQFTDSAYQTATVEDMDARYHRVSLSVPLAVLGEQAKLGVDASYQWPESADRLADYHEVSTRLRLNIAPPTKPYSVALSYGISQQSDAAAYNAVAFGEQRRDLQQQVVNLGVAWQAGKDIAYEGKVQLRDQASEIPLFNSSAVDVTAGIRWQLD